MALEIERKFLVDHEAWEKIEKPVGVPLRQGYMVMDAQKAIRIRLTQDKGFITIKGETKGSVRNEFDYAIPKEDAIQLLDIFCPWEVSKRRYLLSFEGKTWEVDVFEGKNSGLIVAEIELKSADEIFEKPGWIGEEVTDDARYYNACLAEHPYSEWT